MAYWFIFAIALAPNFLGDLLYQGNLRSLLVFR